MAEKRKYDSTVARIAGNIASGIVAEVERTEPVTPSQREPREQKERAQ